jgi:Serine carboxypeptidase
LFFGRGSTREQVVGVKLTEFTEPLFIFIFSLFFNGIHDIICNHVGNERFLEKLPWDNAEAWLLADRFAWIAPSEKTGVVSGYMKQYKNLKFLKVMDAGHMVRICFIRNMHGLLVFMSKCFLHDNKGTYGCSRSCLRYDADIYIR